jgi:maltose alpha-D-glucosyltransferase/alpha-amylase
MVTPEEREWMWQEYAPEPRMRLNLGIRRRLAPLVDNDPCKIELAFSILFTLPGSPIIYYGDEIGMGDDIWLKDRDGVRTPMQWSAEKNAGFSSADSSLLYAPVIDDAVYGYQRVNVEAERANPHSLYRAVKRLIAVRKQHPVFGRGNFSFLLPENESVLAYLRQYKDENVLVVSNLSDQAQQVILDLTAFEGTIPLDLNSGRVFPAVTGEPYTLALDRHQFLWLALVQHQTSSSVINDTNRSNPSLS